MFDLFLAFALIVALVTFRERGKSDSDGFELGGVVAIPYLLSAIALSVIEHNQWGDWAVYGTVAGYYVLTFILMWRVLLIPASRSITYTVTVFTVWSAFVHILGTPLGAA